ncbi:MULTISPECIES: coniferyl aldehyde dehydrogenase [unclassified Moraxella]|uniref:coniferyl aldehyde dehydrogenase n=1 Tax=unclassified Moraxella TaxID=2685852 RepID=UPI003AF5D4C3
MPNDISPNANTPLTMLDKQFSLMRNASRQYPQATWAVRLQRLNQLEKLVADNQSAIIEAISQDFGFRSPAETTMLEIFPSLEAVRHAIRHGKAWLAPKRVRTGKWFLPATSYVQPRPLGVVGIIAPWNYPLYLVIAPLAGALVAGNRAMLKVSEATPYFEQWLAMALPQYFSADEVTLIQGDIEVAKAFSQLAFDHLFFTGSTAIGKQIMQSASANLTPVTLELGGKSPVVITPSADIAYTAKRVWTGKSLNAGQTCIAPDYALINPSQQALFIDQSKQWFNEHYPNLQTNSDYSFMVNRKQALRVKGYLEEAQSLGATLHPLTTHHVNINTGFFPPMIVTDLPPHAKLLNEEIFAPILPLVSYHQLDDAVAYINACDRPLALYIFGENHTEVQQVLTQTVSGGACINETLYHIAQQSLPFGGVGASGMGRYHGHYSFDTFSHAQAVFKQVRPNFTNLLQPPYGKLFWRMMGLIIKWR